MKLMNALKAHEAGMPLKRASNLFGIPRSTLWNKVHNRAPTAYSHPGPISLLPKEVEITLKNYLLDLARKGFPLHREATLDSVKKIVDELQIPNLPFINNRPGRKWFEKFLKRFPEISLKNAENLSKARALVTEHTIREWFKDMRANLEGDGVDLSLFDNPKRLWNTDETAMFLAPKGGRILGPKGETVYEVTSCSDKDCITTLLTVNADGDLAPPLALFPYTRIPAEISKSAPEDWGIGRSEKGWMTGPSFYEYVANVFIPYIERNNIPLPIILFMDGHKSHLTKYLSDLCNTKGIILIALPPNATAIMQPLDVAVFRPLKCSWRQITKQWRIENNGEEINKNTFCKAVDAAIRKTNLKAAIMSGFRSTGLFPLNPDKVDYSKCVKKSVTTTNQKKNPTVGAISPLDCLDYIESKMDPFLVEAFKNSNTEDWNGDVKATYLYKLWISIKKEMNSINDQPSTVESIIEPNPISINEEHCEDTYHNKANNSNDPNSLQHDMECEDLNRGASVLHINEYCNDVTASTVNPKAGTSTSKTIEEVFKDVLFSPESPKKKSTRRREKVPSVITGSKWKEYHEMKEKKKMELEQLKEERKRKRKETLEAKQKLKRQKRPVEETSSDSSDEPVKYQSSGESAYEEQDDEVTEDQTMDNLKHGSFALVAFKGGPRLATTYNYVCIIQRMPPSDDDDDDEISVMSLSCVDESKKKFTVNDDDISFVTREQIIAKLPNPKLTMQGTRMHYCFATPVHKVFQKN